MTEPAGSAPKSPPRRAFLRSQILGVVEELTPFRVRGWAMDWEQPGLAVSLILRIDERDVALFRPQLRMKAIAERLGWPPETVGLVAFDQELPPFVADGQTHRVEVIIARTGVPLTTSRETVEYQNPHQPLRGADQLAEPPAARPEVSVIVLNRNGSGVLNALLESWQTHNRQIAAEWVVIDHASGDNSLAMLKRWRSRLPLRIKALKTNQSFSDSCNLGASLARAPHLLFLNNDLVWQHDALPQMLSTLNAGNVCAVGIKLLKTAELDNGRRWQEVQHLGVRFTLTRHGSYLPYEATPTTDPREAEFTPQTVPAVTAAALLCRKSDFVTAGGFHPDYFYGFEDVEFCLRLARRTGQQIVSRNDLVALHHHGHTRLTGREAGIDDRIRRNQAVLTRHLGPWISRAWWHDLLQSEGQLCRETLRVGFWVGRQHHSQVLSEIGQLAGDIRRAHPGAQTVLLHDEVDPFDTRGLHVLIVADPAYDIAALRHPREDLRLLAWIGRRDAGAWASSEHLTGYDALLSATPANLPAAQRKGLTRPIILYHADRPLAACLALRVQVVPDPNNPANLRNAIALRAALQAEQLACWIAQPDGQRRSREITVHIGKLAPQPETLDAASLQVWWNPGRRGSAAPELPSAVDWFTKAMPSAAQLAQQLEARIGRTFSAPELSGSVPTTGTRNRRAARR